MVLAPAEQARAEALRHPQVTEGAYAINHIYRRGCPHGEGTPRSVPVLRQQSRET